MTDGDDRPQDQPGGWLPPSAPGSGEAPNWNPAPPPRPEVEGLPPASSPVSGVPDAPSPPPAPAYPPPAYAQAPHPQAPPPGQYAPPGQYQAPGQYPPPGPYGQPGWYQPPPSRPTNGTAVAALVLGIAGIAVTLFFAGVLFIVSIPCSIAAWVLGVKGKKVAAPDPLAEPMRPGGRGMAQAGLICGIAGIVLAILAIVLWVMLFSLGEFNINDFQPEEDGELFQSVVRLVRGLG